VVQTPGIKLVQTSVRCIDEVQRLRFLGYNEDGHPIIALNWFYGEFWDDGAKPNDVLLAFADFVQEVLDRAERAKGPKGLEIICVCSGGPPPGSFIKHLVPLMEQNFPEVLYKASIYPIPWPIRVIVNSALWFLPSKTRQKIQILGTEDQMADFVGLAVEQLPPDLRGGVQALEQRARPDTRAKIFKCLTEMLAKDDLAVENGEDVSTAPKATSLSSAGATSRPKKGASISSFFPCFLGCFGRNSNPIEMQNATLIKQKSSHVVPQVVEMCVAANDLQSSESMPKWAVMLLLGALIALLISMVFGVRSI